MGGGGDTVSERVGNRLRLCGVLMGDVGRGARGRCGGLGLLCRRDGRKGVAMVRSSATDQALG